MNKIVLIALLLGSLGTNAQQKIIKQAIVKSKTEVTLPENPGAGPSDAGGDRMIIIGGPGGGSLESTTTTYFKTDWVKVASESDFGNNTIIIDRKNKKTTTLIEAMGKKTGFFTTEADEEEMRKLMQTRLDSIRKSKGEAPVVMNTTSMPEPEIVYADESKKIAGYDCKKAIIKSKGRQGEMNETIVWYCPDFKMAEGYPIGSGKNARVMGAGPFGGSVAGLEKLNGFPMAYTFSRSNGFKMSTEVTKIELDPSIDDKVFEIPKGYDLKSMKDSQNGGTFDIRIGGPGEN